MGRNQIIQLHRNLYLTGLIILRDSLLVGAGFYVRYVSLPKPRTLSRYFDVTLVTAQLAPTFISKCNTSVQLCLTFGTLGVKVALTSITTVASAISYIYARKSTYRILKAKKTKLKPVQQKPRSEGG
ncbi:hypothetical protein M8J75_013268 [Diaphorina citri]|nr:hypothetical protein M8J75_013268 [Diaphorina citri]